MCFIWVEPDVHCYERMNAVVYNAFFIGSSGQFRLDRPIKLRTVVLLCVDQIGRIQRIQLSDSCIRIIGRWNTVNCV